MPRESVSLDGTWRFVADPERLYHATALPVGEPVRVPGCWETQVARPYRIINAWYRRDLPVPKGWSERRVILRFGAVMYRCVVFVNGVRIGEHEGGYTPFEFDVTDALHWDRPNDLAVAVVNPLNGIDEYPAFSVAEVLLAEEWEPDLPLAEAPHGKQTWYSSQSGIWQSVSMEARPALALGQLQVRPDVPGQAARIRWTLKPGGPARDWRTDKPTIEFTVMESGGKVVGTHRMRATALSGGVSVDVPSPRLWDTATPYLYTVRARLFLDGEATDDVSARFGMREIRTEGGRILLNGRPIYVLGALDQDLYPDTISTPPSRRFLDEQLRLAKEMGINLLRCHIKVPDPRYLEAADEAGMLLWCELPNWTRFTSTSARRGRETLQAMVDSMGNHPSIIIWTIINEDWGTQLRYEARDRRWLRETFDWLKLLDPSRLVVDNSACETPQTPNFHLKTDVCDFHVYFAAPDNAIRWRQMIADFARRPSWLWSPHGDAEPRGDEPLILSEFGTWGLPRLDRLIASRGREPWWFGTGRYYYRPSGLGRRFLSLGLDRIWPDVDAMAEATQWHQFEALQFQIGCLRRHDSVQGFVVTELSDAYWEANGLLDPMRGTKVFHDRITELISEDIVVVDTAPRDLAGGSSWEFRITVSSFGRPAERGVARWEVRLDDGRRVVGDGPVDPGPVAGAVDVASVTVAVPDVDRVTDATLSVTVDDDRGDRRATTQVRLAVLPPRPQPGARPLRVAVHDPLAVWRVADRIAALGHRLVDPDESELLVTTEVTHRVMDHVEAGGRVLLLVRSHAAIPDDHELARRISVHLRRVPHSGWPGQRSPWEGDWVTSWSWLLPGAFPTLPRRDPLDFAYEEVLPDHVMLGYDPVRHRDEVTAGMFVGWAHTPAAIVWKFRQGRGAMTLTTFRVAPESGPVASALLDSLLHETAGAERRGDSRGSARAGSSSGRAGVGTHRGAT